jgi:Helix-turn-helix of DDE superfamily endonuclease
MRDAHGSTYSPAASVVNTCYQGQAVHAGVVPSVAMVLALLRQNIVQQVAAEIFGVSQSTVSRCWDTLRKVIEAVLAEFVLTPGRDRRNQVPVLVDGTLGPYPLSRRPGRLKGRDSQVKPEPPIHWPLRLVAR